MTDDPAQRADDDTDDTADGTDDTADGTDDTADGTDDTVGYGTRWRLAALVAAPAVALAGVAGALIATDVLAVSYTTQSGTVRLTTGGLRGNDLGITVVTIQTPDGPRHTVRIGVGAGRINGLCISQRVEILGRPFTLIINGGDRDPSTFETSADGLVLDLTDADGKIGAGGELAINKNGADVDLGDSGIPLGGSRERVGIQAGSADLRNVTATVKDITIPNLLDVSDFSVRVAPGNQDCPPPGR